MTRDTNDKGPDSGGIRQNPKEARGEPGSGRDPIRIYLDEIYRIKYRNILSTTIKRFHWWFY